LTVGYHERLGQIQGIVVMFSSRGVTGASVARLHGAQDGDQRCRAATADGAAACWRKGMTVVMGWAQRPTGLGETRGPTKKKERKKFNRRAAGLKLTLGWYWSWAAITVFEFN
jgi:hypothetical protein